jgi:CheY-like chemotaxis protein
MSKVLVVDDSAVYRKAIAMALVEHGFTTLCARTGEEGIKVAETEMPALILLDMLMPKLDGMMFLRLLRGGAKTRTIPVIVLSGNNQERDIAAARALGVVDYISKDCMDSKEVAAAVWRALKVRPD